MVMVSEAPMFQTGMWSPVTREHHKRLLRVEGVIPKALRGTYYRNGPNPIVLGQPGYHQFDGDGMVHAICLEDGRAFYTNRWVETEKFTIESHFNKKLFYYYREFIEQYSNQLSKKGRQSGPANTGLMYFDNRLFALHENSAPIQIDPKTLETIGQWDYLKDSSWQTMTAHPKVCPTTKQLHTFSYHPLEKRLQYYCLNPDGILKHSFPVVLPYAPLMVHDFAITADYLVFMLFPLVVEPNAEQDDQHKVSWKPAYQSRMLIYKKETGEQVCEKVFEPYYSYHFINAYQTEDRIIAHLFLYEGDMTTEAFWAPIDKPCSPYEFSVDLTQHAMTVEKISKLSGDFATIDQSLVGHEYQTFVMCATTHPDKKKYEYNAIAVFDVKTRTQQTYDFGLSACCTEPYMTSVFDEDEQRYCTYILVLVYDKPDDTSQLVIFDLDTMNQGPICRLFIDERIPFGFHGLWVSEHD